MNRKQLRQLAELRLKEATSLLRGGLPSGAYYLGGYAVECALKACIAKKTQMHEFPPLKRVKESYTHDLTTLVGVARLDRELQRELSTRPGFKLNWLVVQDWSEESRYAQHSKRKAQNLLNAIVDSVNGVMPWLRARW